MPPVLRSAPAENRQQSPTRQAHLECGIMPPVLRSAPAENRQQSPTHQAHKACGIMPPPGLQHLNVLFQPALLKSVTETLVRRNQRTILA
jgi:hypothetical protein